MALEILAIIDSNDGLSPLRRQGMTWANSDLLSIGPVAINLSENLINKDTKIVIYAVCKIAAFLLACQTDSQHCV